MARIIDVYIILYSCCKSEVTIIIAKLWSRSVALEYGCAALPALTGRPGGQYAPSSGATSCAGGPS
jgi:hypothetical protein